MIASQKVHLDRKVLYNYISYIELVGIIAPHCLRSRCLFYLRMAMKTRKEMRPECIREKGHSLSDLSKGSAMGRRVVTFRANAILARQLWGDPSHIALRVLRDLTRQYSLSVAAGDLQFLEGKCT